MMDAGCCKWPGGLLKVAWGVAEGYRGLLEDVGCVGGNPMVSIGTDLTNYCFPSQLLLINTNNELKNNKK
jgi:hypothetical protein